MTIRLVSLVEWSWECRAGDQRRGIVNDRAIADPGDEDSQASAGSSGSRPFEEGSMGLFAKHKTTSQLGSEATDLIRGYTDGRLDQSAFAQGYAAIFAELAFGMRAGRFGLDDVNSFERFGDLMTGRGKFLFARSLFDCLASFEDRSAVMDYAMMTIAERLRFSALEEGVRMQKEQRWSDCLQYCDQASRALPYLPLPEPVVYLLRGVSLEGLGRIGEALSQFTEGEAVARAALDNPGLSLDDEERSAFARNAATCAAEVKRLAPHV